MKSWGLLLLLGLLTAPARGQSDTENLRPLTTEPEADSGPTLAAEGKDVWMAFSSARTGNADIYAIRLSEALREAPKQLAPDPASDHSPALSPDGHWLAWVSDREDALGDVWVMKFPDGTPKQVTQRGDRDGHPRWSADGTGNLVLLYDVTLIDGTLRTEALRAGRWSRADAVDEGAPAPPPLEYPAAERGRAGTTATDAPVYVISVHADDTDGDGSLGEGDDPSVWVYDPASRGWRQMTPPLAGLNAPQMQSGRLILSATVGDNLEVVEVALPYVSAEVSGAADGLERATAALKDRPLEPFTALAAARQGYVMDSASETGQRSLLFAVDILREAARPEAALNLMDAATRRAATVPALEGEFAYRRALLEVAAAGRRLEGGEDPQALAGRAIETLSGLQARGGASPEFRARLGLESARLSMLRGDSQRALATIQAVEDLKEAPESLRAEAMLDRARVYRTLLPQQAETILLDLIRQYPKEQETVEAAALEYADLVQARAEGRDGKVLALREAASRALELSAVQAATHLVEGGLFANAGNPADAAQSYAQALKFEGDQPLLGARVSFALAELLSRQAKYAEAIETYEGVSENLRNRFFRGAPEFIRQARQNLIRQLQSKGNFELRVNDPHLARATFAELIRREPDIAEGWRGYIEAENRIGLLTPAAIEGYHASANAKPDSAVEQYKYGLALTYLEPLPEKSMDWLRRAIVRDGTVPYFHQTLGFVHEHLGRVNNDRGEQASALQEYQRALALMDAAARPEDYATLLINAGNAGLAMGNNSRAVYFYQRWKDQSVKITDPRTEFLFYRSFGIALFRSGRPRESAAAFATARELIGPLRDRKLLAEDRLAALETELLDRQALAMLESGDPTASADMFGKVAALHPEKSLNRVRALRNRGVALHRLSLRRTGIDRELARRQAETSLAQAVELIRDPKLTVEPELPEGGDELFGLKLTMGTSTEGSAQQSFSKQEEERLLSAALARVRLESGRPEEGIEELRSYLAVKPELNDGNRAYYATARLVALDQLARELQRAGRVDEALATLVEGVETARFEIGGVAQYNAGGLSRILARLVELTLAGDGAAVDPAALKGTWLGGGVGAGDAPGVVDAMLARALSLRAAEAGPRVIEQDAARGRLLLARALLGERLAAGDGGAGVGAVRRAAAEWRAEILARQVIDLGGQASSGGEIKRLALLSYGVLLRAQSRVDDEEAALKLSDEAESFAKSQGYPGMVWWLRAQPVIMNPSRGDAATLDAILSDLESLAPGEHDPSFEPPYDLIKYLERLRLAQAVAAKEWEPAWYLAERWRAAALRLAFDSAVPPPNPNDPAEENWTARLVAEREKMRDLLDQRRNAPASEAGLSFISDYTEGKQRLTALIEEGRTAELHSVQMLAPRASELADAEFLIAGGLAIPAGASLVLNTNQGGAAWSAEGLRELPDAAARETHAKASPIWFVLGEPMASDAAPGVTIVNMLTFESTFAALYNVRFDTGEAFVDVAKLLAADPDMEKLRGLLAGEPKVELPNLRILARDPFAAFLGDSPVQLGSVLPELVDAVQIRGQVSSASGAGPNVAAANEAAVAAALSHGSLASAELDGRRWIGSVFSPELLPEAAETEAAGSQGLLTAFLERGETQNALGPARKLYLVQKALHYPTDELAVTGTVLSQIEQRLGRLDASVETARQVAELRRAQGNPAELAAALRRLGNAANEARDFDTALAAYDEVIAIEGAGGETPGWIDAQAASGAVLENAGRPKEAVERFEIARQAAQRRGDAGLESRQWSRIGRIELRWLNRYDRAEAAFAAAEERAGSAGEDELRLGARLDKARVREKVGDYDGAMSLAEEVRAAAEAGGFGLLQADALLVASSIEWARADYFKAFKAQREAMEIVDTLQDAPMRVVALNRAGLIYWALNDAESAYAQFNEALDLAAKGLDLGEVASTYNNRGLVYRQEKRYDEALADFAKGLDLDERQANEWGLGYSTRNTGMTYLQMGDAEKSIAPIEAAIGHSGKIGDVTNLAKAVLALGDARRALNQPAEAEQSYREAIAQAERVPLPEVQWRALFGLAQLDLARGDRAAAKVNLEAAIEIVERLRARIKIEEFQDGFLQDKQELYDVMVTLLIDEGDATAAFNFSERSRGRSFIDLLGNSKIALHSERDAAELEEEKQLRARVSELERQRAQAEEPAQREALDAELEAVHKAYADFMIDLKVKNPQVASFVEVPTQDLASLQALIEPQTRVLVYHMLPNELVAWVISKESIQSTRTQVTREELAGRLQGFRQRLQNFDDINEELAILSRFLLEPNLPLLGDARQVCVVPHRELHRMPFAALRIGLEYFIDRYALFYSPSASVLRYTYAREGARTATPSAPPRMLALGNPDLGNEALALPFAQKEAERISWTFPGAEVVTREKANESWLRENSGKFDAIHLATHGEYDAAQPLLSAILLTGDGTNDGRLTAQEIFSMTLKASFVALSACQSGLGKLSNGDDIVGLNRAFVYAGTRQVLSTLWRVDDVSTAVLIKHFYRNSSRTDRAQALRQAQLDVRTRYPHPAHWSGIFLSGDWK